MISALGKTGALFFPNAELAMHENEPKHWFNDAEMAKNGEREKKLYFQAGREQVEPYRKRWKLFTGGEVFPGVTAIPSMGHTPGHTAFHVSSGNEQLMISSDTAYVPALCASHPGWHGAFDQDAALAEISRRKLLDRVIADNMMICGSHFPWPGLGRIARDGAGYAVTVSTS